MPEKKANPTKAKNPVKRKNDKPKKTTKAKPKKPANPPFGEPEKEGPLTKFFSQWCQYCLVRYAENYSQDDEKAFLEELEKEYKEKIQEKLEKKFGKKVEKRSKAKFKEELKKERKKYTRHINDLMKLRDLAYHYETTKDHTILPDLFMLSHRLKVYPPLGVLAHLAKGFQEFSESKGKKPLDTCLGIREKRGTRSRHTQQEKKERDQFYVSEVRSWTMVHGLHLEDACMIAADQYKGPQKLPRESIEQKWRSKKGKAYRNTLDENDLSDIKKRHPSSKGRRLTPAKLLMPIALCLAATKLFPTEDEERRCMEAIERTMQVAHLVPKTSDYLPGIQKILDTKKAYYGVSKRLDTIRNIIREALEDPKNPLEFPKNPLGDPKDTPPEKAFLLKQLSS